MGGLFGMQGAAVSGANAGDASAAGRDFIAEARVVYRIAACAGSEPVPAGIRASVVNKHCEAFRPRLRAYVDQYVNVMQSFIGMHRPAKLPSTVVYPFGGADLLTALTTYPDASEIYTLSLEHAGDIRHVEQLGTVKASSELAAVREVTAGLLGIDATHTLSINTNGELMALQEDALKNPITLFLVALAIHGQEPVSLRYFVLDAVGDLRYLAEDDFSRLESTRAQALSDKWEAPTFSSAFSNYELRFKPVAKPGPIRIHRHIAANLENAHFGSGSAVFRHLLRKERVVALTKGSLNLLWDDAFSNIRDYLTAQADVIISDCSGVSPLHGQAAGFAYKAFGRYEGMLSRAQDRVHERALLQLFQSQPERPIPARYGYADKRGNASMLIMYRQGN